jgi:hypothetical protein
MTTWLLRLEDKTMPFSGYEDFAACVTDQKKKGHTEEEARKICGYLQDKAEKRKKLIEEQVKKQGDVQD